MTTDVERFTSLEGQGAELIGHADDGTPAWDQSMCWARQNNIKRADVKRRLDERRRAELMEKPKSKPPREFVDGFLTDFAYRKVLRPRGVDPAVWDARGCRYYWQGDPTVKEAFRPFGVPLGSIAYVVKQSNGWLMPRHAPEGFPPASPQLRPNKPVFTSPPSERYQWHYHGPVWCEWPRFPAEAGDLAGHALPRRKRGEKYVGSFLYGHVAEQHVNRETDPDKPTPYDIATGEGQHAGVPIDVVHRHAPELAKYVLPPGEGTAARIDIHPWSAALLPDASLVFFVLEGIPKSDAVLSHGGIVFGVPSVTTWDVDELTRFAEMYLLGKTVLVVPDADWAENWQVERQALKVRTLLRELRIASHIAAPPTKDAAVGKYHKGVDDFLGAGQHTLEELVIEGREFPDDMIERAVAHVPGRGRPLASIRR